MCVCVCVCVCIFAFNSIDSRTRHISNDSSTSHLECYPLISFKPTVKVVLFAANNHKLDLPLNARCNQNSSVRRKN